LRIAEHEIKNLSNDYQNFRAKRNTKLIKMSKTTPYEILYEDEQMIAVNKSAQVLSIPDRHRPELTNIYTLLLEKYKEIYVVHRIDKDTSGVLIFAKTAQAHKNLSEQFEGRSTVKIYKALVIGCPFPEEGRIEAGIANHPTQLGLMCISSKGKESITEYKVIEKFKNYSLLECNILTGRTHQIRVHLKHIGHPLVVDHQYGGKGAFFLSDFKKRKFNLGKWDEEVPMLSRVPLHSFSLTFQHPTSGEQMTIEAEMPKDMRAVLSQLSKWDKNNKI
jgi:RluA family pseudouridine synthase